MRSTDILLSHANFNKYYSQPIQNKVCRFHKQLHIVLLDKFLLEDCEKFGRPKTVIENFIGLLKSTSSESKLSLDAEQKQEVTSTLRFFIGQYNNRIQTLEREYFSKHDELAVDCLDSETERKINICQNLLKRL